MTSPPGTVRRSLLVAAVGLGLSVIAVAAGLTIERWRFGAADADTLARIEAQVEREFARMAAVLERTAGAVAEHRALVERAGRDPEAVRELFEVVGNVAAAQPDLAITLYGVTGHAVAWAGRPSELPSERIGGPTALFVAPGPLGVRLIHIEPIEDLEDEAAPDVRRRLGSVAAERVLTPARDVQDTTENELTLDTFLAPVSLRTRYEGAGDKPGPNRFVIQSASGEPLLEVEVSPGDLASARERWRAAWRGVALALVGLTLLLACGPLLEKRDAAADPRAFAFATLGMAGLVLAARALFWLAPPVRWAAPPLFSPSVYASARFGSLFRSPVDLLLTALAALALTVLLLTTIERWRIARRAQRRAPRDGPVHFVAMIAAAAAAGLLLLAGYQVLLQDTVDNATVDVLYFSLHPWDSARLALVVGLLVFHAVATWTIIAVFRAALAPWRFSQRNAFVGASLVGAAALGIAGGWVIGRAAGWPVVSGLTAMIALGCLAGAQAGRPVMAWYRNASQAARVLGLFLAFLIPAVLVYPAGVQYGDRAKRRLIERQYALQAARHPQELQVRLAESLRQIDTLPPLAELVAVPPPPPGSPPPTDNAFLVWRQTDLAEFRLTSAIELYGPEGTLTSRFALNFPEYAATEQTRSGAHCQWDVFGEASPFGSEQRRQLHAERAVCAADGRVLGGIVVHVMLDYGTLPFLSTHSPYFELFRPVATGVREDSPGRDVELVIYGWGRLPIYATGPEVWALPEPVFTRAGSSRDPFWTRLVRGSRDFHVYILNDRGGIYALGYPALTTFDSLVRLAELSSLAGLAFVLLVAGSATFSQVTGRARAGRVLLREIRQSFYRKLFIAFVAASVVPVLVLALVIRAYFATRLRLDVEAEASRTAAVARRVTEDLVALQQRGSESLTMLSDDEMVWISKVIDQDVNLFVDSRLVATSERDLFASGLLPTRTPDDVYRAILLQRLPSFVGDDVIGNFAYMVAAAPVRLGGRDAILTVPLALRQREIEREIDDLDRGVSLGALVFVLLGAGIGFWAAEYIADPVRRLTRATRRIARGEFDAEVTTRGADELQELVQAFNRMAADLKVQQQKLERTHRLEAWADMARQVAHEIKNPLTPIQLSAEHLRRVHQDRGAPLGPVVDGCVTTVLNQVRLLRQIAAEFSSFASTPAARPSATAVAELVQDVIEPYRAGLAGRIGIHVDVPSSLPLAYVDRTLVARALTNIIENALHAMPGGGSLSLASNVENGHLRLEIRDTGVGMDAEGLKRIFEPYFSTKASGTGLGLTIAKRNVELTQGTIAVTSEKGKGTIVTLTLPLAGPDPGGG